MTRLDFILVLLIMIAAVGLVNATSQTRMLFSALEMAQQESRNLDVEWGKLQLEISAWSMPNRVNQIARQRLDMAPPTTIRYLNLP